MTLHVLCWSRVAPILGLPETDSVLPARTTCPFCQGKLSIYQDTKSGEEWAHCSDCHHSSSVLDLAAKIWDVPFTVAVERLSAATSVSVTSDELNRYIKRQVIPREKTTTLWHKAQRNMYKPENKLGQLRIKLGLRTSQLSVDRVAAGPAKLFGVSHVEEIHKLWEPMRSRNRKADYFKGRHWQDVIVVPYFKAPGDVSSLLFIGRQGRLAQDQVFITLARRNETGVSTGFAGLNSVVEHESPHVICMSDALAMLRIQVRHFNTSIKPLPIVGWRADDRHRLSQNWYLFNGKKLIFWEWEPSAAVLYQCMVSGGSLTLNVGPKRRDHRGTSHWVRGFKTMHDVERLVVTEAKDWKDALYSWSKSITTTDGKISDLLASCSRLDYGLHDEVRAALKITKDLSRHYTHTTNVGPTTYTERAGAWFRGDRERPLMPGHIEVHYVITRDGELPEYVGDICLHDDRIPFRISGRSQRILNRELWDVIETKGYFCERKLPNDTAGLIQLALAFRRPQIIQGAKCIGWDGEGFQLANCRIAGGVYVKTQYMLPAHTRGPQGSQYRWRPEVMDNLRSAKGHEAAWTWAIVFSFGAQLVAHMTGRTVPWLAFDHPLHCDTTFLELLERLDVPLTGKFWDHNWPVVSSVTPQRRQRFRATIVNDSEMPRTNQGLYVIIAPKTSKDFSPKNIPSSFKTVLPDFLKWVTANRTTIDFSDSTHWQLQILALFKQWAQEKELKSLYPVFKKAAKCLTCLPSP